MLQMMKVSTLPSAQDPERELQGEIAQNKRIQGTPQPNLSSVVTVELAASPGVNSWLKGAPDAHADMRLESVNVA